MKIKRFEFNMFPVNCYVLWDETKEAVVIDPGCFYDEEKQALKNFINTNGLKLLTAYYQLTQVKKGKEKLNRFLLFKIGKKNSATLIYIEGNLNSDELVALLFQRRN